ncbi:DUF1842 domain-containing protein [Pseudomonas putida]
MAAIGLFHTRLHVRNNLPGAAALTLDLLVNSVTHKISGTARITQATYPAVDVHADVWGEFAALPVGPGGATQITLRLDGNPGGSTSELAQTFHLHGLLASDWAQGNVSYRYFNQGHWVNLQGVPAKQASDVTHQAAGNGQERLREVIRQLESA